MRQEFDGVIGRLISDLFSHHTAKKGEPGTALDTRLNIVSDKIYGKPKGDSFSNHAFEKFLTGNNIGELILCGLDAGFCIYHTAIGAHRRGYSVTVVTDAIAAGNENKLEKIIRSYRKRGFRLTTTDQL